MKPFVWSSGKNDLLREERGISVEDITIAVESGGLLEIVPHPNRAKYPRQKIMVVEVAGYAHLAPFIEEDDHFFLKTIIPSRKATRDLIKRESTMTELNPYELEVLQAYESGALQPTAGKVELQRMRAAARATAIKDKRVNIRLSSVDLMDIQAKALAEGMPYQTLIASVLHKYVTGRLSERKRAPESKARSNRRSG